MMSRFQTKLSMCAAVAQGGRPRGGGRGGGRGDESGVALHHAESAADGSVLIVPNSDVSTVPVRNMSRREKRIVRETLSLDDVVGRCTVKVFDSRVKNGRFQILKHFF